MRLVREALAHWWDIEGYAVAHGVGSLPDMPLSQFVSFMWYMISRSAEDDADLEKMKAKLWQPPKGQIGEGPWAAEAQMDSFRALKGSMNV